MLLILIRNQFHKSLSMNTHRAKSTSTAHIMFVMVSVHCDIIMPCGHGLSIKVCEKICENVIHEILTGNSQDF